MAVDFKSSQTKDNLMRAFAGESQARNRYTFAAGVARQQNQQAIAQMFTYTADQEKEHAEIFYDHLKELAGENIHIDGTYPVDLTENLAELLKMAQHNEYEEHDDVYKHFEEVAREEGFDQIAASFHMIAEIEKSHGDRFGKFAEYLEQGTLHKNETSTPWICLNCGYIYEGDEAPLECPVCHHDQGYYIRLDQSPFADGK